MRSKIVLACALLIAGGLQLVVSPPAGAASARGMWVWGANSYGQLGEGTTANVPLPITGPAPSGPFVNVSGAGSSVGNTADGTTWAWGYNGLGQLGNGTTTDSSVPVKVAIPAGITFTQVDAGNGHDLALDAAGHVWAWGNNLSGELGDGTTTERKKPVRVHFPAGVTLRSVSAGGSQSMALDTQGRVWEWGSLGGPAHLIPVRTTAWPNRTPTIGAISAGNEFDLALSTAGRVYAWGNNEEGQLGNGTYVASEQPGRVHLPSTADVQTMSASTFNGFAIDASGRSWAWGNGNNGDLGNGSFATTNVPVRISTPAGVTFKEISGGPVALATDGSVWTWGPGYDGELGDGTFGTSRAVPGRVHIPQGVSFDAISGGESSVYVLGTGTPGTDLFITHQGDNSSPPQVGDVDLGVGNSGSPSGKVTLTYTMPPHSMFLSADATQGSCSATPDQVTCALGPVVGAADVQVHIRPLSLGTYSTNGHLSGSDATPGDNSFSAQYAVTPLNNAWRYVDVTDSGFQPDRLQVLTYDFLEMNIVGSSPNGVHDASGLGLFDSSTLTPPDYFAERFLYPGTYPVADELGHSLSVKVPISVKPDYGATASIFAVRWNGAPAGDVADVQIAYCSDPSCTPSYSSWRHGTTDTGAAFSSSDPSWQGAGTYFFRSRIRKMGTQIGPDWSPAHPVTVIP